MTITLGLLLMMAVCVCLFLAAFSVSPPAMAPRISWFPLGMLIWALKVLFLGIAG